VTDGPAVAFGELAPWPSRERLAELLTDAGLRVDLGRYALRVEDCEQFSFSDYGGDLGTPVLDAHAETVERMLRDARIVSDALCRARVRHRFEVYDEAMALRGYVHFEWPVQADEFRRLMPEVPGELGDQARLDATTHPPRVERFHLDLTNWLGDDLVEVFPCFAVTQRLADALRSSGFTGYELASMVTTVNPDQREFDPGIVVPEFKRLLPTGRAGADDFGTDERHHLVVSRRCWDLLRRFAVAHCDPVPIMADRP